MRIDEEGLTQMMSYKITDVEGIGQVYAEKLGAAGILTTEMLLRRCGEPSGRDEVAEQVGVTAEQILHWVTMADLMRIKGIGGEYAELLKAAGVDTVKELRTRNASHLAELVAQVNFTRKLTRRLPSLPMTMKWIEEAKSLEPTVNY